MADLKRDLLGFLLHSSRDYGDIVPIRYGRTTVLMLHHPSLLEEVLALKHKSFRKGDFYRHLTPLLGEGLFTADGQPWSLARVAVQPAFGRARLDAYADDIVELARRRFAGWPDDSAVDVHREMSALTLSVVLRTMFGVMSTVDEAIVAEHLPIVLRAINQSMNGPEYLLPGWIPTLGRLRMRRAIAGLDHWLSTVIDRRQSHDDRPDDLLSMLLRYSDGQDSSSTGRGLARRRSGPGRRLRDQVMTMILAGHETTAAGLSWACHLLAEHSVARRKVQHEVDGALAGRAPQSGDLSRLAYTRAVVLESMRLYPPIHVIARQATVNCEIGGCPVPAGRHVAFSQYTIHRDPRFFVRPDEFVPERWVDGSTRGLPGFAYFPFGGGPRLCVGKAFAEMEATLILASLIQRFTLETVGSTAAVAEPVLTLRPRGGLWLRCQRRAAD